MCISGRCQDPLDDSSTQTTAGECTPGEKSVPSGEKKELFVKESGGGGGGGAAAAAAVFIILLFS